MMTCPVSRVQCSDCIKVCQRPGSWKPESAAQVVIEKREHSHGDYLHQARMAQDLKKIFRDAGRQLSPEQSESLDMIAVKLSRILTGNPNEADHWVDIAGYATLISNMLRSGNALDPNIRL